MPEIKLSHEQLSALGGKIPEIKRVKKLRPRRFREADVLIRIGLDAAKLAGKQAYDKAKKSGITDSRKLSDIRNNAADKASEEAKRLTVKRWAESKIKQVTYERDPIKVKLY
jgi:hypothetical protein